jgi:hypothetical protein
VSGKPGFVQMWIGTVVNSVLAIVQLTHFEGTLSRVLVAVSAALGALGAIILTSSGSATGRRMVYVAAVVFAPIGLIAGFGARRLRDEPAATLAR